MNIHCKYDELIDPNKLVDHPKNRNKHSKDQIERLAHLYSYHGVRHPIIVSKLSGYIVAGHGRKLSAISSGIKAFPVVYQEFEDEEAEYAFLIADNSIALWAELDLGSINIDVQNMSKDFDLDLLGIKDFSFEIGENADLDGKPDKDIDQLKHILEVTFTKEQEMMEVYEDLLARGFIVRCK